MSADRFTIGRFEIEKAHHGQSLYVYVVLDTSRPRSRWNTNPIKIVSKTGYLTPDMDEVEIQQRWDWQINTPPKRLRQRDAWTSDLDIESRKAEGVRMGIITE